MSTTPAVRVEHLAVRFPDPRSRFRPSGVALVDASLTAPVGMVTVVVGTNGAGKTTLLRALVGAVRPEAGTIEVLGRHVGGAEQPVPPGVSLVPDAPLFPDEWHAGDVIRLHRRLRDDIDAEGFLRRLRRDGIGPRAMLGTLSAGKRTLFSVDHALASAPQLMLLDEPFARLDPLARADLIDRLRDHLAEDETRSILLSTHDLEDMARFADHLVVLHEGSSVLQGALDELLERHVVATFPHAAEAPIGARPLGASGAAEALLPGEDALGLPAGTTLRPPDLADLVRLALTAASIEGATR